MSRILKIAAIAVFLALIVSLCFGVLRNFFSARQSPSAFEAHVARRLRALSIPKSAASAKNPVANSAEVLQEAARHFADHCASCHGNDGSGHTEMGQHLFPKAPDMQANDTQELSDGELYYIVHNGVRWTGMPAWGEPGDDQDTWKLVWFIRHLPDLTPAELRDMERFNPKSAAEQEEEKEEQEFLEGAPHQEKHQ
jgi:mono/diheme cytochrome c family protein